MAITTYLIRMVPLVFFRKKITNCYVRAFLNYVPCACLSCMTVPAIIYSTNSFISGISALCAALISAYFKCSLVVVAIITSLTVFITELIII